MDRLISEQAVIESIEFFQMNPQHFDFVNLIDDIKDIPSAEQRWIPVSERLPTSDEEYHKFWVTDSKGNVTISEFYLSVIDRKPYWSGMIDVIAWMPLPQPYKTESEDNKMDEKVNVEDKLFGYKDYLKIRETLTELIKENGYTKAMIRTVLDQIDATESEDN